MTFIQTWFAQGFLHPLLTPSHIILLLSLGFLIGQQGLKISHMLALIISSIAGVFFKQKLNLNIAINVELILLGLALVISLIVVLKPRLPSFLGLLFVLLAGAVIAYDSDPIVIPGLGENSINSWLLGAVVSISASIFLFLILALFLKRFWDGIILRILGSWIATSAIFILTLSLTKGLN